MKVERMVEIETNDIHVGDKIHVGKYTATCQTVTRKGAIFMMDQYLDKGYPMNRRDTNMGGYAESNLRETLRSKEILDIFKGIRDYMVPFKNGDLLRIPFAGELFDKLPSWCEPDGHEQWLLMQDRRNRIASRCGEYEWGWLQNKDKTSSTAFCGVDGHGAVTGWGASNALGVRPVFQISMKKEDTTKKSAPENEETIQDVFNTFNDKQRLVLNYLVGKAVGKVKYEKTIKNVLDTFNDKQRLVLNYIVSKAVEDAKKEKTSESDEDKPENDNTESNEEDKKLKHNTFDFGQFF